MKKRGQKKPGYYLEGHMLPCVRNLRPMFGSHDAAIQANQINTKPCRRDNIMAAIQEQLLACIL